MRHINDDIEDLFQKAAEEYPLRTGTPDWKAVQDKLFLQSTVDRVRFNRNPKRSFQKSAVLILFTIIPLGTALTGLMFNTWPIGKNSLVNESISIPVPATVPEVKLNSGITAKKNQTSSLSLVAGNGYFKSNPNETLSDVNLVTLQDHVANNDAYNYKHDEQTFQEGRPMSDIHQLLINNTVAEDIISPVSSNNKDAIASSAQSSDNTHSVKIKSTPASNLYGGIFAESELTNVKGQSFRKPGFNGGFLLGYNLNKKVQAEVGLVFSRKYYYSDGKYAAPNSLRQDGLPIGGVNIYSKITEIPITLRYNLKNTIDNKLFASAGGVMNIVNQERYNYGYTKNGRAKKGFKKYDESIDNVFSNIQLSVGYEHKLGNIGYMRVEPYYRIPLNGIGTSNLPVTSVGINLGLVKHFK